MAVKAALLGLAALAAAALGGCARISPAATACKGAASSDDQAQAKLAACAKVIAGGARGDALEQALVGRGEAYTQTSDFDRAISDFGQALRMNPRDSSALDGRGVAYLDQGKSNLARELAPSAALPWANRGYDFSAKRQWDSAIADFDDALSRSSDYGFALQGRADAERGKGDAKAAIKDFDAVLSDPHGDNALADAEAVVALSPPGDPEALNTRCWVRGVLDTELPAALADCQQSLTVRPTSAETLDSLAFIYFRQGRFDDALTQYNAALTADPKQTPSLFMRGIVKLRLGDASGQDDIAAATSADKNVAGQFAGWGVKP